MALTLLQESNMTSMHLVIQVALLLTNLLPPSAPPLVPFLGQGTVQADRSLDFWFGRWKVYENGQFDGEDVVTREMNGFACTETWKGVTAGDEGKSQFYYMPAKKQWKQVWITPFGVYKEKFSEPYPNGIRFAGTVFSPGGREVKDRTTLSRLPNGEVHQVIESLKDGKWLKRFDAIYRH